MAHAAASISHGWRSTAGISPSSINAKIAEAIRQHVHYYGPVARGLVGDTERAKKDRQETLSTKALNEDLEKLTKVQAFNMRDHDLSNTVIYYVVDRKTLTVTGIRLASRHIEELIIDILAEGQGHHYLRLMGAVSLSKNLRSVEGAFFEGFALVIMREGGRYRCKTLPDRYPDSDENADEDVDQNADEDADANEEAEGPNGTIGTVDAVLAALNTIMLDAEELGEQSAESEWPQPQSQQPREFDMNLAMAQDRESRSLADDESWLSIPATAGNRLSDRRLPVVRDIGQHIKLEGNYIFLPILCNNPTWDAILIMGTKVVILQMTVSDQHPVKAQEIVRLLDRFDRDAVSVQFAYVIPEYLYSRFARQSWLNVHGKVIKNPRYLDVRMRQMPQLAIMIPHDKIMRRSNPGQAH